MDEYNLTYIGPDPSLVGGVPLRELWPALNHFEADADVRAEKIASGSYRAWRTSDGDEPQYTAYEPPTAETPAAAVDVAAVPALSEQGNAAPNGADGSESTVAQPDGTAAEPGSTN